MKKIFQFSGIIVAAFILTCFATFLVEEYMPSPQNNFTWAIEARLSENDKKIPLKEITDFEWDDVYVVRAPYSKYELDRVIGFESDVEIPDVWCDPEQKADVIFVRNNNVTIFSLPTCEVASNCAPSEKGMWFKKCGKDAFVTFEEQEFHGKSYKALSINEGL